MNLPQTKMSELSDWLPDQWNRNLQRPFHRSLTCGS
jgi:hypothetical protein